MKSEALKNYEDRERKELIQIAKESISNTSVLIARIKHINSLTPKQVELELLNYNMQQHFLNSTDW